MVTVPCSLPSLSSRAKAAWYLTVESAAVSWVQTMPYWLFDQAIRGSHPGLSSLSS